MKYGSYASSGPAKKKPLLSQGGQRGVVGPRLEASRCAGKHGAGQKVGRAGPAEGRGVRHTAVPRCASWALSLALTFCRALRNLLIPSHEPPSMQAGLTEGILEFVALLQGLSL